MLRDRERREVIIIEGARQVGKSYLVTNVLEEVGAPYRAYDLEKEHRLRRQIAETEDFADFRALLQDQYGVRDRSLLFLDEVQECRALARYVKSLKEDWPELTVVLTGSSMNRFFSEDTRLPVGRTRSLCVFPFVFPEFLRCVAGDQLADVVLSAPSSVPRSRHELLLKHFDDYLVVGGYPEAVKAFRDGHSPSELVDEIMASLAEDFQRREEYQPGLFSDVIRAVANHLGAPSKYSHVDATKHHAKRVIEAMKAWHVVLEVQPYSLDPMRSSFLPKRYLHDVGVATRWRSLAAPSISIVETIDPVLRTPLGGLFENAVLLNLLAGESARKTVGTWRKAGSSDTEVDFVVDLPGRRAKVPIECKATLTVKRRHLRNVLHYLAATGQSFGILVSAAPLQTFEADGRTVLNLPVYLCTNAAVRQYFDSRLA